MRITYFGHSCFKLEQNGFCVVIDPFADVRGYQDVHTTADMVLCSHDHFDHNAVAGVKRRPGRQANPFGVTMMETFHDDAQGAKRGKNIVHILSCEGRTLVHLGDLGHLLNERQLSYIAGCDALMIPIGGTYTIDIDQAWELIHAANPKIVIPMHYRNGKFGFENLQGLSDFLVKSDRKIAVTTSDSFELPAADGLVLVPAVCE